MKKLLVAFAFSIFHFVLSAQPSFISDSLDSYIQEGIKDWNIPGLAIAIVKDGNIILMKGYGVRDIKTNDPVDENTLFMIASNSSFLPPHLLHSLTIIKNFPSTIRCLNTLKVIRCTIKMLQSW